MRISTAMLLDKLSLWEDSIPRSGPLNMALDEAVMEQATEPWLRIYQWNEPTVSIGFSQSLSAIPESNRAMPLVRRWTGGGVVVHDGDWTYTLAVPAAHPFGEQPASESYRQIHEAMITALAASGIADCALQPVSTSDGMGVCFTEPARFDVVRHGQKIAGAAQRRSRAGFLHQGTIQPLQPPPGFAWNFARALAKEPVMISQANADKALMDRAKILCSEKYNSETWLHDRRFAPGKSKQRIFVYGTLKHGGHYSHYLSGQTYLGEAYTEPSYRMMNCGSYPGLYPVERQGLSVQGEVWEVDADCRAQLDILENVAGGEYKVAPVRLLPPYDSQDVSTYIYLIATNVMPDAGNTWKV